MCLFLLLSASAPPQVERRGTFRGGYYDPGRSRIQAMKEIKASEEGGPEEGLKRG